MMWPRSLQWRLSLCLGLALALLWVAASWVTAHRLRHEMDVVFDSALEETAQRILPLAVVDIIDREADDTAQRVATLRRHDEYFTYVVRDAAGTVLLSSHNADPAVFPPFSAMGFANTATHRIYFDAALQGTVTIAVAEPLARRNEIARSLLIRLAVPLMLVIPLNLLGVWAIVRFSMAPIRAFRSDIEARGGGDLTPVKASSLPREMLPVAQAVNHLLDRLARALQAERSFTANSAHELRTPVAAALAQTQRLIAETSDDATRRRGAQIELALQRLSHLSEKLMQLARAEGGRLVAERPVDIAGILNLVICDMRGGSANDERIELIGPDAPLLAGIDSDAFAILARNLIENALKHGAPYQPVRVELSAQGVLRVINGGEPVPADMLARLSQPFERGSTQAKGSGLGLAIAKAIAAGCGGTLELMSPAADREDGFEARFVFDRKPLPQETAPTRKQSDSAI